MKYNNIMKFKNMLCEVHLDYFGRRTMRKLELYMPEDTIFVQIASYRDPELQWTLKDLFEKAKRPENIFVGI